jgi:hypothetical protein
MRRNHPHVTVFPNMLATPCRLCTVLDKPHTCAARSTATLGSIATQCGTSTGSLYVEGMTRNILITIIMLQGPLQTQ